MFLTRRRFLLSIAGAAGGVLGAPPAGRLLHGIGRIRAPRVLRLGHVVPATTASARDHSMTLGFQLGIEEAQHAARLFGVSVEPSGDADAARLILASKPHVVIGGTTDESCARIAELAAAQEILFFNVGCSADASRGAACRRTTFHITASDAMRRDALTRANASAETAKVLLWHETLERYGAGQLNPRFRDRFGAGMDSDAWSAWMAVKIAAEAFFRMTTDSSSALLATLEHPSARFDGHKGRPLSFRSWDHQLRQPLYVIRHDDAAREMMEVPGRTAGMTTADQLDQLGTSAASQLCRWETE